MSKARRLSASTLALAGLLALLGIYVYLVEVRGGGREGRADPLVRHPLPFPADSAMELVIERPGERIVCRKQQGQWRIAAPIHADADDLTIQRILTDFAESKVERTVAAHPADLSIFG